MASGGEGRPLVEQASQQQAANADQVRQQPVAPQPQPQPGWQQPVAPQPQPGWQPQQPQAGWQPQQPQAQPHPGWQQPAAPQPQPGWQPQSQPQPQPGWQPQPQPQYRPAPEGPQHVHHSYIWLGSLRALAAAIVIILASSASSVIGMFAEAGSAEAGSMLVAGIVTIVVVVAIVALAFGYHCWSYRHLTYELGSEEFSLNSGIFSKKRVHVPYQRVQSVDLEASLLQRLFGVCSARIDTAGGASNKAILVPYLQKSDAEQLRFELFARKKRVLDAAAKASAGAGAPAPVGQGAPAGLGGYAASVPANPAPTPARPVGAPAPVAAPAAAAGPANVLDFPAELWGDVPTPFGGAAYADVRPSFEYGLTNKELVFTGLSNSTAFGVMLLAVIGVAAQIVGEIVPAVLGVGAVEGAFDATMRLFGGSIIVLAVVALLGISVIGWVLSIGGACLSFGGFRARRRASRIEVERGLLRHQAQSVDVDRVQSVIVKQSFIRRCIGYCELSLGKIDAANTDDTGQQQSMTQTGIVVHPFVKLSRVQEILDGLVPEFADIPLELVPLPRVALRRAIIRRAIVQGLGFWLAVAVSVALGILLALFSDSAIARELFSMPPDVARAVAGRVVAGAAVAYTVCAVIFAFEVVDAVLWQRRSGFAYNDRFMRVLNGGLSCESVSFPRRKIQFGFSRTNPLQRLAGTATICARTAAGIGGTTTRLIDVDAESADAWLRWLEPRPRI